MPRSRTKYKEQAVVVEAQGWVISANGNVVLTAEPVAMSSQAPWLTSSGCQ